DLNIGFTQAKTRSASATQPVTTYIIWPCPSNICLPGSGLAPNEAGRGYLGGVTPEALEAREGYDESERSRLGLTFNHRPLTWFNPRLVLGADFTNNPSSVYFPRGSHPGFGLPQGVKVIRFDRSTFATFDYSATGTASLNSDLVSQ